MEKNERVAAQIWIPILYVVRKRMPHPTNCFKLQLGSSWEGGKLYGGFGGEALALPPLLIELHLLYVLHHMATYSHHLIYISTIIVLLLKLV